MSQPTNTETHRERGNTSRRDLFKVAAVGAAGAGLGLGGSAMAPAAEQQHGADIPALPECDVAIVGGGVAGCYLAYRLATATAADLRPGSPLKKLFANKAKLDVCLFEYSGRFGGRLLSVKVPGINANEPGEGQGETLAEFGGFRFARTMHIVWDTAKHLGLTDEPFNFDCNDNIVYARGQHFTREQVNEGEDLDKVYNLSKQEKKILVQPGGLGDYLTNQVFQKVLPDASDPDAKKYGLPPKPNGYSYLKAQFQAAFILAEKGDQSKWADVKKFGDAYEQAKQDASEKPSCYPLGRPLSDWSYWALSRAVLSQEAVDLLEDTGGYNSEGFAGNFSANVNEDFYFVVAPIAPGPGIDKGVPPIKGNKPQPGCAADGDEDAIYYWRHINEGYSAIPGELWKGFVEAGGRSHFNHQLVSFSCTEPENDEHEHVGPYDLLFYKREPGPQVAKGPVAAENICREHPDQCARVQAKLLFLALPGRSLELIDQNNFFFQDQRVQQLTRKTANNIPAIRMFIAYHEPWWLKYGINRPPQRGPAKGRNTTDLGLRQYYNWWTPDKDNANQNGLTLASYASGQGALYWHEIQDGQPYDHMAGSGDGSALTAVPPDTLPDGYNKATGIQAAAAQKGGPRHCSRTMALEAHQQLMEVNKVPEKERPNIPLPYYAHFQNWTKDPFGAGWHAWSSGSDQQKLIPQIRQPIPTANVFVVGEAFSDVQGWVQGALNSAESTLQCNLRLKWPKFLNPYGTWLGNGTRWLVPGGTDDPCIPPGGE